MHTHPIFKKLVMKIEKKKEIKLLLKLSTYLQNIYQ